MTSAIAKKITEYALEELKKRNGGAAVSVCDEYGYLYAFIRTDNIPLASIQNAHNKAYTAAMEKKPSIEIGNMLRDEKLGYDIAYYNNPRIIGWGGGVPVYNDEEIIGCIGVSGLPEEEDIAVAEFVAKKIEKEL